MFPLLMSVLLVVFFPILRDLIRLALDDQRYSYILLVPVICGVVLWLDNPRSSNPQDGPASGARAGIVLLSVAALLAILFRSHAGPGSASFSALVAAAVAGAVGLTIYFHPGMERRRWFFPATFLLLMIPLPFSVMEEIVRFLQNGSAEASHILFRAFRIPVVRTGPFIFELPGVSIEVAEECSGIRSGTSLFVSSIVAGHLFFQSSRNKALLILLTIPAVIFKNALRIVVISWLGVYVDPGFLYGTLHQYSGLPFSVITVGMLVGSVILGRKWEGRRGLIAA